MNLTDAQKQQVATWIDQGLKLSEIQSKLAADFGASLTYMEVRFLIDDLKLKPKDPEPPKPVAPPPPAPAPKTPAAPATAPVGDEAGDGDEPEPALPAPGATNVKLTMDQLARPGALVSGKVTFSDGQSAEWYLDQMGRLGLTAATAGYRPPETDLPAFQAQLQALLASAGF